ncbi:hypothetical protein PLEOSDRAFT_1076500 [Pleurotus ostreatus PC15]|uniref:Endoplasmic reticulum junction formation protein lunapark n=1 Tax=Pleurotus ostreatus (strain PC15) TaxID=1137138 RepID=A0A067P223_PLEO1|nr:hypothetical protein PLEOSDRAFT_1076500 [Pleurotus ostreatus PC15]
MALPFPFLSRSTEFARDCAFAEPGIPCGERDDLLAFPIGDSGFEEEDYETVLSTLSRDVQSRQQKLADIRLRERRSTLWSTLYTAAAYGVYVCLWYFQALTLPRGVALAPVLVGPLIVLFIRRIVQLWYSRKEAHEEKTLQHLLKQQRTKVEEIKKKTNYYSTRNLLSNLAVPRHTHAQAMDKLADALLGEDDQAPPSSRYALICEKCFKHNGLLPEAMWEDAQFRCIKCDHLNASVRSKREARRSMSPSAASTPPCVVVPSSSRMRNP